MKRIPVIGRCIAVVVGVAAWVIVVPLATFALEALEALKRLGRAFARTGHEQHPPQPRVAVGSRSVAATKPDR